MNAKASKKPSIAELHEILDLVMSGSDADAREAVAFVLMLADSSDDLHRTARPETQAHSQPNESEQPQPLTEPHLVDVGRVLWKLRVLHEMIDRTLRTEHEDFSQCSRVFVSLIRDYLLLCAGLRGLDEVA